MLLSQYAFIFVHMHKNIYACNHVIALHVAPFFYYSPKSSTYPSQILSAVLSNSITWYPSLPVSKRQPFPRSLKTTYEALVIKKDR